MSNQFFQSDQKDIGLFTFYRSQQEQEQRYRNLKEKLKDQLHKNDQLRQKQQLERSIINQKQKSQQRLTRLLNKSDSKNKIRQNKSNRTEEVTSRYKKNTQEDIEMLQKRANQERLSRESKTKKADCINNSLKRSLIEKKVIQSKQLQLPTKQLHKVRLHKQRIFSHTPELNKSDLRQRMHTHFDNHFRRKLDKSKEQEAIKIKLFPEEFKRKTINKVPIKTFKEKLLFLDTKSPHRLSEQQQELMASKTHKQLHQQNKKYFNSLIENDYLHPEYNQTVYRILRDTLKLPLVSNSRRYIKTEQNSPSFPKPQSPKRSSSFFKKIISKNQIFKQSLKQFTQKHISKVLVKGSLITQQTFGM